VLERDKNTVLYLNMQYIYHDIHFPETSQDTSAKFIAAAPWFIAIFSILLIALIFCVCMITIKENREYNVHDIQVALKNRKEGGVFHQNAQP